MSIRELEKKKASEKAKTERETEIKYNIEMGKYLDQKENEKNNFFEIRRRIPNDQTKKLLEDILKKIENNKKNELNKIRMIELENIRREKQDDEMRKSKYRQDQKNMKEFYDMQVESKRRNIEYEKSLDNNQARIWKEDIIRSTDQAKEENEKVFMFANFLDKIYEFI